jgi:hypothetical protein
MSRNLRHLPLPATVVGATLGFTVLITPGAKADDPPDPSDVLIERATYAGSGCPAGSASISKSNDNKTATLSFDKYVTSIGPGTTVADKRKTCTINVKPHYPAGYQYAIRQTNFTGYADLHKKVRATEQLDYSFAGSATPTASFKSTWVGPYSDNYSFNGTPASNAAVWSPCGKITTLNVSTKMHLDNSDNPGGSGLISTDPIDDKVKMIMHLEWRKCQVPTQD